VSYATITTLEPLTDVSYIPCVSLLDFWLRSGSLELVVYAHSIDFGKKGFGNLVQVAELQRDVASELNVPVGPLVMIVKSATIYQTELSLMSEMISSAQRAGKKATSASHGVVRLILYCDLALRASVGSHCFCSRIVNALGEIRRRKWPILICLDGVDVARAASGSMKSRAKMVVVETTSEGATSVGKSIINLSSVTTVGLDLAKHGCFGARCCRQSDQAQQAAGVLRFAATMPGGA
jgi:hypothetical protein